jgi:hypothetical protein
LFPDRFPPPRMARHIFKPAVLLHFRVAANTDHAGNPLPALWNPNHHTIYMNPLEIERRRVAPAYGPQGGGDWNGVLRHEMDHAWRDGVHLKRYGSLEPRAVFIGRNGWSRVGILQGKAQAAEARYWQSGPRVGGVADGTYVRNTAMHQTMDDRSGIKRSFVHPIPVLQLPSPSAGGLSFHKSDTLSWDSASRLRIGSSVFNNPVFRIPQISDPSRMALSWPVAPLPRPNWVYVPAPVPSAPPVVAPFPSRR